LYNLENIFDLWITQSRNHFFPQKKKKKCFLAQFTFFFFTSKLHIHMVFIIYLSFFNNTCCWEENNPQHQTSCEQYHCLPYCYVHSMRPWLPLAYFSTKNVTWLSNCTILIWLIQKPFLLLKSYLQISNCVVQKSKITSKLGNLVIKNNLFEVLHFILHTLFVRWNDFIYNKSCRTQVFHLIDDITLCNVIFVW